MERSQAGDKFDNSSSRWFPQLEMKSGIRNGKFPDKAASTNQVNTQAWIEVILHLVSDRIPNPNQWYESRDNLIFLDSPN